MCESSVDTEGVGIVRGAQVIARLRNIDACLLFTALSPTTIFIDNASLHLLVTRQGLHGLSRASARRYVVLGMRFDNNEINPQHQPDEQMMADFGTKWLAAAKLRASLRYATNSVAWHGDLAAFTLERLPRRVTWRDG